jgi:CheY-like chemotaxis protein/DnaJ-domain-containing protein 1
MSKILLAEDDANLRETLSDLFRVEGYEVVAVPNGQAALDALDQPEGISVIVLDCLLPKVAGFDVAKFVRGRGLDTPIVFMSGVFKSPDQQKEAREKYGAKAYLTKPFDNQRLIDAVKPLVFGATAKKQPAQPMPAEGTLLENPVLYLLWRAAGELQTGILEIFGDKERARIFCFKGRAVLAQHSDQQLNVGIELVRDGVIDAEMYRQAVDLAVQRSVGLYDVLKAEGWATEPQIKAAYKALIPRVIERSIAATGRFRWVATDEFTNIVPTSSVPLTEAVLAAVRAASERDLEAHIGPRRPLRLAPGDHWSEMVPRLAGACGSDSIVRSINGRATIAQMLEAAPNPNERASRFRQVYLLMSTMAVRASLEPIAMAAPSPAPSPAPAPSAPAAAPAPEENPFTQQPRSVANTPTRPHIDESGDEGVVFTPEEEAAREYIDSKFHELQGLDHYTILGLQKGADAAAVKRAYLMLARDFHTDAFPGQNLGSAHKKLDHIFATIQTAYSTLSDPDRRAEYEAKLAFEEEGASTDVAAILQAESEFHKAQMLVDRGELGAALRIIERIVPLMPKNDELLGYQLYCGWWTTKSQAAAPQVLRQLEEHYKNAPGALMLKEFQGWIAMEIGDNRSAKNAFKRVLDVDPAHQGATRGMRQLQRKLDEAEKKSGSALSKFLKR